MSATTTRSTRKDLLLKYKLASKLYDFAKSNAREERADIPTFSMQLYLTDIKRVMKRYNLARNKGFKYATAHVGRRLSSVMTRLESATIKGREVLDRELRAAQQHSFLSMSDIMAEINALFMMFERVEIKSERDFGPVLAVTVGPITLEDVNLGSFKIELNCNGYEPRYWVRALEPNCPGGDSDVTHPHVNDDVLCEGDGSHLIRNAFKEGRISDFFLIVEQILNTYNSESAYVELQYWEGIACYGCDTMMSDGDDTYSCDHEGCERQSCEDCSRLCQSCDSSLCSAHACSCDCCGDTSCRSCLEECRACGHDVCGTCTATCKKCDKEVCSDCFNSEKEMCNECHENSELLRSEEEDDDETED